VRFYPYATARESGQRGLSKFQGVEVESIRSSFQLEFKAKIFGPHPGQPSEIGNAARSEIVGSLDLIY